MKIYKVEKTHTEKTCIKKSYTVIIKGKNVYILYFAKLDIYVLM